VDNRYSWLQSKAIFQYPIRPAPRTAVLVPGFRSRGPVRVFADGWGVDAAKFAPQAIAASLPQLDALAGVAAVTHAVVVLRKRQEPRLTEFERERLWQAFHVPVFEQMIGEDCSLLASECEAHNGLHIDSPSLKADHEVDDSPCGCGRKEPRLLSGEPAEAVRRVAAYAR
jgi:hypothetical protein